MHGGLIETTYDASESNVVTTEEIAETFEDLYEAISSIFSRINETITEEEFEVLKQEFKTSVIAGLQSEVNDLVSKGLMTVAEADQLKKEYEETTLDNLVRTKEECTRSNSNTEHQSEEGGSDNACDVAKKENEKSLAATTKETQALAQNLQEKYNTWLEGLVLGLEKRIESPSVLDKSADFAYYKTFQKQTYIAQNDIASEGEARLDFQNILYGLDQGQDYYSLSTAVDVEFNQGNDNRVISETIEEKTARFICFDCFKETCEIITDNWKYNKKEQCQKTQAKDGAQHDWVYLNMPDGYTITKPRYACEAIQGETYLAQSGTSKTIEKDCRDEELDCGEIYKFVQNSKALEDYQTFRKHLLQNPDKLCSFYTAIAISDDDLSRTQEHFDLSIAQVLEAWAEIIRGLTIAEKYYNPEHTEYDNRMYELYKLNPVAFIGDLLVDGIIATDYSESQREFAALCGFYNGLIETVAGIPEAGAFMSKLVTNEDNFRTDLSNTLSQLNWETVKTLAGQEWEKYQNLNSPMQAYGVGKLTFNVVTLFIGVGEINALVKTGRLSSNITEIISNTSKFFKTFITKKVLIKSNGKFGVILDATKLGFDDATLLASKWIKPEKGWFDIVVHGTPDNFMVYVGDKWVKITHRDLAKYLRNIETYKDKTPIRLISCNTGVFPDAIGKKLANKIGVKVKAPKGLITVFEDGSYVISNNGEWRLFNPGKID